MKMVSSYPVLLSDQLLQSAEFYCVNLGFIKTFESDWYVSLASSSDPVFQLALLQTGHASIPAALTQPTANLILNFECSDVDAVYDRLIGERGLPCLLALRDEPWGQRHFITRDPNGILIDIIQMIPPTEEFASQYTS
ncbi:MAG: VOC family protein [Puniceicoccaceae bacterium]